jgi:hypothetical protein
MKSLFKVVKAYKKIPFIEADNRCSFHVHIEIEDFIYQDAIYMIQKWIQMEPFFFMLTNKTRWSNNYGKFIENNIEAKKYYYPLDYNCKISVDIFNRIVCLPLENELVSKLPISIPKV